MQIIKIIIYSLIIAIVTIFEEPRISQLLALVFPGEFSKVFSYLLPVLVVAISVFSSSHNLEKFRNASVLALSVLLVLSYVNTILVTIEESKEKRILKIDELKKSISTKQNELKSLKSARVCYSPSKQNNDEYEQLLESYRNCQAVAKSESTTIQAQAESLQSEILTLTTELQNYQNQKPEYLKPLTQAATGFFLSVILSICTSVFCYGLSNELKNFLVEVEMSDSTRLAILLSEGKSIRQIAVFFGWSKSTAERRIRLFRLGQGWDKVGTPVGQSGTGTGQPVFT